MREGCLGVLGVEGPHVEVLDAIDAVQVVQSGSLAKGDTEAPISVQRAAAGVSRKELLTAHSRELGEPPQIALIDSGERALHDGTSQRHGASSGRGNENRGKKGGTAHRAWVGRYRTCDHATASRGKELPCNRYRFGRKYLLPKRRQLMSPDLLRGETDRIDRCEYPGRGDT